MLVDAIGDPLRLHLLAYCICLPVFRVAATKGSQPPLSLISKLSSIKWKLLAQRPCLTLANDLLIWMFKEKTGILASEWYNSCSRTPSLPHLFLLSSLSFFWVYVSVEHLNKSSGLRSCFSGVQPKIPYQGWPCVI